ncbi:MAG: glycoside hydrolase family 130 protein [Planctomycetota bacterium]
MSAPPATNGQQEGPISVATTTHGGASVPWQARPPRCCDVVWRYDANPVIKPSEYPGFLGVFNSAIVPFEGRFVGVFRVEKKTRFPRLHFGSSTDGLSWQIETEPITFATDVTARPDQEYAYDPRVCEVDGEFYITWCAGDAGPTIGMAKTTDFKQFHRLENAFLPSNRNGVLFPEKIGGFYWMLSRPSDLGHTPFGDIHISRSPDLEHWGGHRLLMRSGGLEHGIWWQVTKIGAGPNPIKTPDGWLILYHGVMDTCNGFEYSMGGALLDLNDPTKVLYRKRDLLLTPEMDYERGGHVNNVVFPCAALHDEASGRLAVYYGAADTSTCLAFADTGQLIESIKSDSLVY